MAGYSETPLLKKLGIKPDFRIILHNEPSLYLDRLSPLPEGVKVLKKSTKEDVDLFTFLFYKEKLLKRSLYSLKRYLRRMA